MVFMTALFMGIATFTVEIPYVFFACLLFTVIFYPMAYLAQVLIYAFPSIEVSAIIGVLERRQKPEAGNLVTCGPVYGTCDR
ncbi:hypothetical protein PI124_g14627 [Phytophthora idaei]|nr:hypothetical protein PI124_g14627 [Phytophthora idaei]